MRSYSVFEFDQGILIISFAINNGPHSGNTGQTDHLKPEQIDHPKIWRKVVNLIGEV